MNVKFEILGFDTSNIYMSNVADQYEKSVEEKAKQGYMLVGIIPIFRREGATDKFMFVYWLKAAGNCPIAINAATLKSLDIN